MVVGTNRQLRGQLPGCRDLLDRHHDFLDLGARHRGGLDYIRSELTDSDAVGTKEQTFTINLCELSSLEVEIGIAQGKSTVDEGIEELGLATMQLLGVLGELVVIHRYRVYEGSAAIVVGLVVDIVVPSCTTDPYAIVALIAKIKFGEQV
ncbi:hypothetical protein D3C78_1378160 [compost metagenome]